MYTRAHTVSDLFSRHHLIKRKMTKCEKIGLALRRHATVGNTETRTSQIGQRLFYLVCAHLKQIQLHLMEDNTQPSGTLGIFIEGGK